MKLIMAVALLAWCVVAAAQQRSRGYAAEARRKLAAIEDKIDAVEARAQKEGVEARKKIDAEVAGLRNEKAEADRELARFERAAQDEREILKNKLDYAIRKLENELKPARKTTRVDEPMNASDGILT